MKKNLKRKYSFLYLYEKEITIAIRIIICVILAPLLYFSGKKIGEMIVEWKLDFSQIIYCFVGFVAIFILFLFVIFTLVQIFNFISYLINVRYIPLTTQEIENHKIRTASEYKDFIYKLTKGFNPKKLTKRIELSMAYEFYLTNEKIYEYFLLEEYEKLKMEQNKINNNIDKSYSNLTKELNSWIKTDKNPFLNINTVEEIKILLKNYGQMNKSSINLKHLGIYIDECANLKFFKENKKLLNWYQNIYRTRATKYFLNYTNMMKSIFIDSDSDFVIEMLIIPFLSKGKIPMEEHVTLFNEETIPKNVDLIKEVFTEAMSEKYKRLFITPNEKLKDFEIKAYHKYHIYYDILFKLYKENN